MGAARDADLDPHVPLHHDVVHAEGRFHYLYLAMVTGDYLGSLRVNLLLLEDALDVGRDRGRRGGVHTVHIVEETCQCCVLEQSTFLLLD